MLVSRRWLCVSLVSAAAASLLPRPARADDPRQILIASLSPNVAAGYFGEQATVTTPAQGRPHREVVHVYRRGNVLRVEYSNGQILFDDGNTELLYLPRLNVSSVVERSASKLGQKAVLAQRRAIENNRVTVALLGEDSVAGRAAYVVQVQDTMGTAPPRKIWIDKETSLQLRQDISRPERSVSTYFTSVTFQTPPAEKLTFTPPPGTLVDDEGDPGGLLRRPIQARRAMEIARSWGGQPVVPSYLPPRFIFRGYYLHRFNDQDVLISVYGDGVVGPGHKLSIFQAPATMRMPNSGMRTDKRIHALNARKGSVDVTLVSPLPESELKSVMDSISPQ